MAGSLRKYTVQEADNAALGQAGSIFIDHTTNTTDATAANGVFVAITIIADAKFDTLTPEDGAGKQYIGTGAPSDSGTGNGNVAVGTSIEFPAGVTIYGRWSTINLGGGSVIAYIG
tara:strand:- start:71 stop:418 length:348 start_codon:yes stop_codon:yes gene_type:complete